MATKEVLAAVEDEIARLQLVRRLLSGENVATTGTVLKPSRGATTTGKARRAMSAEARERIASAQRKRWAAVRKAAKKAAKQ